MQRSWTFWAFCGFAIVGGYYLLTRHLQHVTDAIPYLLLMACPIMHLFHGHGGHGYHGHGHPPEKDKAP